MNKPKSNWLGVAVKAIVYAALAAALVHVSLLLWGAFIRFALNYTS